MLFIDGSQGEGGGQVLRTSLGLSLVTGRPFRIVNIRANRPKPGLMRQHLTCVEAATRIGRAETSGAAIGSIELSFVPTGVFPGSHRFSIGSAGSTSLVLQTVLPALLTAEGPTQLTLEGGTHNPLAPPFEFLRDAFLPLLNRLGPRVQVTLDRPGFYPAGGGRLVVSIEPCQRLHELRLLERGPLMRRHGVALVARLPRSIAEREVTVVAERLSLKPHETEIVELDPAFGPGNVVIITLNHQDVCEVIAAFGQKGVSAERVANQAARAAECYLAAEVPVGEHLADQLIVPLALAGGTFRTMTPSSHTRTNVEVVQSFLPGSVHMQLGAHDATFTFTADKTRGLRVNDKSIKGLH